MRGHLKRHNVSVPVYKKMHKEESLPDKSLQAQYLLELKSSIKHIPAVKQIQSYFLSEMSFNLSKQLVTLGTCAFLNVRFVLKVTLHMHG